MKQSYSVPERLFPELPPPSHPIGDGGPAHRSFGWSLLRTVSGLLLPVRIPERAPWEEKRSEQGSEAAPPQPLGDADGRVVPDGWSRSQGTDRVQSVTTVRLPVGAERTVFPRRCPW